MVRSGLIFSEFGTGLISFFVPQSGQVLKLPISDSCAYIRVPHKLQITGTSKLLSEFEFSLARSKVFPPSNTGGSNIDMGGVEVGRFLGCMGTVVLVAQSGQVNSEPICDSEAYIKVPQSLQ